MRIGIIEICVEGHYVVVNALIKTYLSSGENEVLVFTTASILKLLEAQNHDSRLQFIVMDKAADAGKFIHSMNDYKLDRIHYSTITMFFREFYHFTPAPGCKEFFHFHNIDLWFMSAFKLQAQRMSEVLKREKSPSALFRHFKYSVKDILRDYYRKKLIKKLIRNNATFILLSEAQKQYLSGFVSEPNTVIFPSLVYESPGTLVSGTDSGSKIRVCVPGAVIQSKKEYDRFLAVIEKDLDFYKQHFIFDLLGKVSREEPVFPRIERLEKQGLEIYYYTSFIDVNEFDMKLYESDIILSNLHMSEGTSVQNKETAAVYQMIKGAKPGIFPRFFQLDEHFRDSVLKFDNYELLHDTFMRLAEDRPLLESLKSSARKVSHDFTPEVLLKRLIP